MKKKLDTTIAELGTEEKIKNAARKVFYSKGYAATRTRDIAEEAGLNLALLNYYFRSKENLFEIIMLETVQNFFKSILEIFEDEESSFEEKVEVLAERYINFLSSNPELPIFMLSELQRYPNKIMEKIGLRNSILKSHFFKQLQQGIHENRYVAIDPLHFMMNLMALILFPFLASPIIKGLGKVNDKDFKSIMQERKIFIPLWLNSILKK